MLKGRIFYKYSFKIFTFLKLKLELFWLMKEDKQR